jgi:multidrug efflux pump subunit AcrB
MVPSQDQGRIAVNINCPPGSSIDLSDNVLTQAEKIVASRPDIENYFSNVRPSGGGIYVTIYDKKVRPKDTETNKRMTQQQIIDTLRKQIKKIPGVATVNIQDMSLMGFTAGRSSPVDFLVMGPDWDKLAELSDNMKTQMDTSGLMVDADTDYKTGVTELLVQPDRKKAAEKKVSMQAIGNALNALFGGVKVGKYSRGGKRYDIIMELKLADRNDAKNVEKVF